MNEIICVSLFLNLFEISALGFMKVEAFLLLLELVIRIKISLSLSTTTMERCGVENVPSSSLKNQWQYVKLFKIAQSRLV